MKDLIQTLFSAQNTVEGSPDGLPYWIFWTLIGVIALLVVFIFLRDKDLRRRLDAFFLQIKNRLRKLRLQATLKREQQKQESFLEELGEKAWSEDVSLPTAASIRDELARLEKKKSELEDKRKDFDHKIAESQKELDEFQKQQESERLKLDVEMKPFVDRLDELKAQAKAVSQAISQARHQAADAEKELQSSQKALHELGDKADVLEEVKKTEMERLKDQIMSLETRAAAALKEEMREKDQKAELEKKITAQQQTIDVYNNKLKRNRDLTKDHSRKLQKDIHEWEKRRDKLKEGIIEVEKQKKPLFKALGEHVEQERVEHQELEILYTKIDRTKIKTQELEGRIKELEE